MMPSAVKTIKTIEDDGVQASQLPYKNIVLLPQLQENAPDYF